MLTYASLRAMRATPDRRSRSARRIALAARAAERADQRRVKRSR